VITLAFFGCKKFERNNPNDQKNPNYVPPPGKVPEVPVVVISKLEIVTDNNADKIVNKGESIKLKVFVKNSGGATANNVTGKITCTNTFVTINSPASFVEFNSFGTFKYLNPSDEGAPVFNDYLNFTVSTLTPDGAVLTFSLSLTDKDNRVWNDTFNIVVKHTNAFIKYSRYDVYYDNNSNQKVNPGETPKLKVYLKNTGSSVANKVRAAITCTSSFVSSLTPTGQVVYSYFGGTSSYDYIEPNGEGYTSGINLYPAFVVSPSTPAGTVLTFSFAITDEMTNSWSDTFTVLVE
jgi:hypothetical protein